MRIKGFAGERGGNTLYKRTYKNSIYMTVLCDKIMVPFICRSWQPTLVGRSAE